MEAVTERDELAEEEGDPPVPPLKRCPAGHGFCGDSCVYCGQKEATDD